MVGLCLTGCSAGPDFVRPTALTATGFVPGATPTQTAGAHAAGGESQYFLPGQALPAGWWGWFGSTEIDRLVALAFSDNPDLAAARARLRGAAATLAARRALRSPELVGLAQGSYGNRGGGQGGFGQGRGQGQGGSAPGTGSTPGTPADPGAPTQPGAGGQAPNDGNANTGLGGRSFAVYTATATINYDLDIAGRNRRLIESARAQEQARRQELQAAYLAIAGTIVSTALDGATLDAQIRVREELVTAQDKRLGLIRIQVEEGLTARADLVAAQADVAALRASIPPLRAQLAASDHALAQLIGRPPAEAAIPRVRLTGLKLPRAVPILLPAAFVRSRPDILAAEAQLAAASAEVGVAAANLYPNLTLDASFGAGGIGSTLGRFFDLGGQLLAPLFDGGRRRAERDVAVAAYEEALATYRSRVLAAFVEVANGIRALESDAQALAEQTVALDAARESLDLASFRAGEGDISQIDVLVVQRTYQDARFAYVDALSRRLQDTASLFAAIGPGPLDQQALASVTLGDPLGGTRAAMMSGTAPALVERR